MWQQILNKWRMSHLAASTHLWVGFLKNHEISGISDKCFSKTRRHFSCAITGTINAKCITNPLQLQLLGAAQAPGSGSVGGAAQSSHPVLCYRGSGNPAGSFVDQDCDRQQCLQHNYSSGFLVWVTLPAVFFIVNSVLGFPSVFLFPLHCCILLNPPLIVECLQLIMAVMYSSFKRP